MAMPTPDEVSAWNAADAATIPIVAKWAGVEGDPLQALLTILGAAPTDKYQALAYLPPDEDETLIGSMVIGGAAPSPILRAKVRRLFRAVRFALDVLPPAAPTPTPPADSKPTTGGNTVALCGTVLQEGNIVIDMMTRADTDAALNGYAKKYGAPPEPIKEPTPKRISCFAT